MSEHNKGVLSDEDLTAVSGGASKGKKYVRHTVVKGDTLGKLAAHYKTTIEAIMDLNPIITNRNLIRIGWELNIPDNR